jgi:hypothetical protein
MQIDKRVQANELESPIERVGNAELGEKLRSACLSTTER